jgi:predicted phage terminase large subunit-like protein
MATPTLDLSALTDEEKAELRYRLELREQYRAMDETDRQRVQQCAQFEGDFPSFVKAAWHVVQPGVTLDWSWHYDLIAEYLTLVKQRKVRRLIINISPRTLKSLLVSVMFPVWVWTEQPGHGFACASYSATLSTEHSVMRRTLIESDWFRNLWGSRIWLAKDQNEKTKFKNNYQAQMIATSVGGSATGLGGNTLILDDGMDPKRAQSDADTLTTHKWFDETWRSRLNNPAEDALIVMEQRTSERDVSGHLLEADGLLVKEGKPPEWTHLAIPLECDEEGGRERWMFPISSRIVTREVGEVLQPKRFPPEVISAWKIRRLVWATQYQQRPSPLEGNMIKRSEVRYFGGRDPATGELDPPLPDKWDMVLTSVDCAFKDEKTSDFVATVTIGVKGPRRYILEVTNRHLDMPATVTEALRHRNRWASSVVLVEDKANGPAVVKELRRKISGVIAIEPEGGKMSRMYAMCGEWQAGDWFVDRTAAWCETVIEQLTKFPGAKHDDICDAVSQAAIYLQRKSYVYGLTDYLKGQDTEMKRKREKPADKVANEPEPLPAPVEEAAKVHHADLSKPDVDDKTERCPNPECRSTIIQRIPGGKRCGQCSRQWGQAAAQIHKPNFATGTFTK